MMHLSDIQVDVLLKAIRKSTGIGLRVLRPAMENDRRESETGGMGSERQRARPRSSRTRGARKARKGRAAQALCGTRASKIAMSATLLADMEKVAHELGVVGEGAGIRATYLTCDQPHAGRGGACVYCELGAPASGKNLVAEKVFLLMPEGAVDPGQRAVRRRRSPIMGGEDPDALKGKIIYVPEAQMLAAQARKRARERFRHHVANFDLVKAAWSTRPSSLTQSPRRKR